MKVTAIFGGTFDPVHSGHLQSALELMQHMPLDELRMLPCHLPPHRDTPGCTSQQRLTMLKLACEHTGLVVDDRELQRDGPSYSVETLRQLREELGPEHSLVWIMGADAFAALDSWYHWRELPTLAHIVVMARPGESLPEAGDVAQLLAQRRQHNPEILRRTACGSIVPVTLTPYPISATEIRRRLKKAQPVDDLLPAAVVDYIEQQQLYQ